VSLNIRMLEFAMTSNVTARVVVYRYNSQWTRISTVLDSSYTVEVGTSETVCAWTATPTSTSLAKGDRLVAVIVAAPIGTMGTGSATFYYNGAAGATGDSYISFTETITFETATPAGTLLYLTDNAPTIDVANTQEALEAARDAGVTNNALTNPTSLGVRTQFTKTAGGTAMEWYTTPLEAFTLSQPVLFHLWSGYTTVPTAIEAELSVHQGDGTLRDIWGQTMLGSAAGPSSVVNPEFVVSGPDYTLNDGDRIRLRLYGGTSPLGYVGAGTTRIYYAGSSGGASGDSYLRFSETLTEYVAAGGGDEPMPYVGGGYYS